jgi:chromosome segregation ATPase
LERSADCYREKALVVALIHETLLTGQTGSNEGAARSQEDGTLAGDEERLDNDDREVVARLHDKQEIIDELEGEKNRLQEEKDRLQKENRQLGLIAKRSANNDELVRTALANNEERVRSNEVDCQNYQALLVQNKELEQEVGRQHQYSRRVSGQLHRLRIDDEDTKAELHLYQAAGRQQSTEFQRYQHEIEQMNIQLRAQQQEIRTLTRKINFAKAISTATSNETKALHQELEEYQTAIEEANEELAKATRRNTMLERSNQYLRAEFEEMYSQYVLFMSHFEKDEEEEDEVEDDSTVPEQEETDGVSSSETASS